MEITDKTKVFIEKAVKVHGSKFNYTLVDYKNSTTKVEIICDVGHTFKQTPNGHLSGNGCTCCAKLNTGKWNQKTTEDFLEKAERVHGNKYDYGEVVYDKENIEVKIKCSNGHAFWQTPNAHLSGKGCRFCNMLPLLDTASFIAEAKSIHTVRFDYSRVEYKDRATPVVILCPFGHTFEQIPRVHLKGFGCAKCAGVGSLTQDEFIEKAKLVHGTKYNYSLVNYVGSQDKVWLICDCGSTFDQAPSSHLQGTGCPNCAQTGYRSTFPGTFYILSSGSVTKIGITNRRVQNRVRDINRDSGKNFKVIDTYYFEDGSVPKRIEALLLKELRGSHRKVDEVFDGHTECFLDVSHENLKDRVDALLENTDKVLYDSN